MVCLCHSDNAINKQGWFKNEFKRDDFPCLDKLNDFINIKI